MAFDFNSFGDNTPTNPTQIKAPVQSTPKVEKKKSFDFESFGNDNGTQEKPVGFVQGAIRTIASPVLRGIANIATLKDVGNPEEYAKDQSQGVSFGDYLGSYRPIGASKDEKGKDLSFSKRLADTIGTGLEASSYVVPIGELKAGADALKSGKGIFKGITKQAVKRLAGEGATIGGLAGGGTEMQNTDATVGSVLKSTTGGALTGAVAGTALPILGKTGGSAYDAVTSKIPTESNTRKFILDSYDRAIKPSITGRKTASLASQYEDKTISAIDSIINNKSNLKFTTDAGEEIGRLPKTVKEFADAVDQTKKSIFEQYDALANQAGKDGAKVDFKPIASELDKVINDKALQLSNPEAVSYAKGLKDRFLATGKIDTKTAQDAIKHFNTSLESFYKNPTYENASRASIDAGVVNNMRKTLDDVIEKSTGKEYQALKNRYSGLKNIEKDVRNRANVEARKNIKGLIDYTDIFSGGDMVSGILTANPMLIAKGATQKGISAYFKYLNNPDRAISNIFDRAERFPQLPKPLNQQGRKLNVKSLPTQYTNELPTIDFGKQSKSKFNKDTKLPTIK